MFHAQKEEAKRRHEASAAEEKKNAIVEWLELLASQARSRIDFTYVLPSSLIE